MDDKLELTDKSKCKNIQCPISLEYISRIPNDKLTLMSDGQCYSTGHIYEWVNHLYNSGNRVGQPNFVLPTRSPITNRDLLKLNIPKIEYSTRSGKKRTKEDEVNEDEVNEDDDSDSYVSWEEIDNLEIWVNILIKIFNAEELNDQDHEEIGMSNGNFEFQDEILNTQYKRSMKYMHQIYARHMFTNVIPQEERSNYAEEEIIDINDIPHPVDFDTIQEEFTARIGPMLIELGYPNYEERINIVLNNYNTILINEERIILDKWLGFLRKILSNESLSDEDKKYIENSKGNINFNHISEKEALSKDIKIIYQVYIRHKIINTPTKNRIKQKNFSIWKIEDSIFFRIDDNIKDIEKLSITSQNSLNIPNYQDLIDIIINEYNNLDNGSSESKSSDEPHTKKQRTADGKRRSKRRSTKKSKRKSKRRSTKKSKRLSTRRMK